MKKSVLNNRIPCLDAKDRKNSPFPSLPVLLLTNAGLRLLRAGFLFFTLRATIPPQTQHSKHLLLRDPKPTSPGWNLNQLGVVPATTKHLSNPTLQLFFHRYWHFLSMLCTLLLGSPFFCLTELTNTLENIVYHTAYIFLGNASIALEDSPTFAVLLSQYTRERSLLDKFTLNNSHPTPIC